VCDEGEESRLTIDGLRQRVQGGSRSHRWPRSPDDANREEGRQLNDEARMQGHRRGPARRCRSSRTLTYACAPTKSRDVVAYKRMEALRKRHLLLLQKALLLA
jgi:hypothetical protein